VNWLRAILGWSFATQAHFIGVWGVLLFGGLTLLLDLTGSVPPKTLIALVVIFIGHFLMGLFWGWAMWQFLNWRKRSQQKKNQ
jgi:hypothetical protein